MNKIILTLKVTFRLILTLLILSSLIFIPAGSISFCNGWIYIGIIISAMISIASFLITKNPELMDKRLKSREKEEKQKFIRRIGILPFVISFIISGVDYRYGWSDVPEVVVIAAVLFVVSGYVMFFFVLLENSYASRIVEVQENQKVIDTGLYSMIRHPMYTASIIIFIFSPVVLGSYYGVVPMLLYPCILIVRIFNEEEVLKRDLKGYDDYMKRIKYRLIPYIW